MFTLSHLSSPPPESLKSQVQQMVEGAAMMQGATYLIRKQGEAIGIENSPALLEEIVPLAKALKLETIHTRRFGASEEAATVVAGAVE